MFVDTLLLKKKKSDKTNWKKYISYVKILDIITVPTYI